MQYQLLTAQQLRVIDERVHAGAERLAEVGPDGWLQTLSENEGDMNVGDPGECPLAIVYDSYERGLREIGVSGENCSEQAANYGVSLRAGDPDLDHAEGQDDDAWTDEAWHAMTEAWRREIVKRQLV